MKKKKKAFNWGLFVLIILILTYSEYILPVLLLLGGGAAFYYYHKNKKQLTYRKAQPRIETLKQQIRETDDQLRQLEIYKEEELDGHYQNLSREILSQLRHIELEAQELAAFLDSKVASRIQNKILETRSDIRRQLARLEKRAQDSDQETSSQTSSPTIEQLAPEIALNYHNIARDHEAILQKIAQSDSGNKEELTAVHEAQMQRYQDVLTGYLKIKASPKDFKHADQRLQEAKEAIQQFDLALDETLQELNEADMRDFDISLRIITNDTLKKESGE